MEPEINTGFLLEMNTGFLPEMNTGFTDCGWRIS